MLATVPGMTPWGHRSEGDTPFFSPRKRVLEMGGQGSFHGGFGSDIGAEVMARVRTGDAEFTTARLGTGSGSLSPSRASWSRT